MSRRTHLRYDKFQTVCGRDLTDHDITDNLKAVTCQTCRKHDTDYSFKGNGNLTCNLCHRPFRDHDSPFEHRDILLTTTVHDRRSILR